jgi:hypothetical protein
LSRPQFGETAFWSEAEFRAKLNLNPHPEKRMVRHPRKPKQKNRNRKSTDQEERPRFVNQRRTLANPAFDLISIEIKMPLGGRFLRFVVCCRRKKPPGRVASLLSAVCALTIDMIRQNPLRSPGFESGVRKPKRVICAVREKGEITNEWHDPHTIAG